MIVNVSATGILEDFLPNDDSPIAMEVSEDVTPRLLLGRLGMPLEDKYLIAVNGSVVPQREHSTFQLSENDKIVIMPPLKGG